MAHAKKPTPNTSGFTLEVHDLLVYLSNKGFAVKFDAARGSRHWKVEVWHQELSCWSQQETFTHPDLLFALTVVTIRAARGMILREVWESVYDRAPEGDSPEMSLAERERLCREAADKAVAGFKMPAEIEANWNEFLLRLIRIGYTLDEIKPAVFV